MPLPEADIEGKIADLRKLMEGDDAAAIKSANRGTGQDIPQAG